MTAIEKGVFIHIQNTIVSSKALVLVKCLNTFVYIHGELMHAENEHNSFHYYVKELGRCRLLFFFLVFQSLPLQRGVSKMLF